MDKRYPIEDRGIRLRERERDREGSTKKEIAEEDGKRETE